MKLDLDYRDYQPKGWPGVTIRIRPLETAAFQRLMKHVNLQNGDEGKIKLSKSTLDFMNDSELITVAASILPSHVESIKGLEFRIGGKTVDATVEDILKYARTLPLVLDLLMRLFMASFLTETETKN